MYQYHLERAARERARVRPVRARHEGHRRSARLVAQQIRASRRHAG